MTATKLPGKISLELLAGDLRQACRQLYKAPAFTATVVAVLAVGFGVSVAIFTVVRNVLLAPLPFKDPAQLVQIVSRWPKTGDQNGWSAPQRDALDWKTIVPAFQDLAIYHYSLVNLTGNGPVESIYGLYVTANLWPMLGVRPLLGNWFSHACDYPGNIHVVVLSHDLWRRRFHSDPQIIGRFVHLDGESYQVVAVMPRSFNFPLRLGTNVQLPTTQMQFWLPFNSNPAKAQHGSPDSGVVARLKPGVTVAKAQAQIENASALLAREFPATNHDLSARVFSLRDQTVRTVSSPLLALLSATALILLLACANIAGLLLARGELHASELAVRMALGGSAWRIARLPLFQGIVLSCLGCVAGVPLAMASMKFLLHLAPVDVPRLANSTIDLHATLFAASLAITSGVFIGLLNALQVLHRSPRDVLAASRTSAGSPRTKLRSLLVVSQIALAVVLISSAGLMLRTFVNLLSANTGYNPQNVFYGVTVLPQVRYGAFEQRQLFFRKLLDRLQATPSVAAAAVSTGFPFVGQYDDARAQSEDMARNGHGSGIGVDSNAVSADYLRAMGVRLLRGRLLAATDSAETQKVAVIDDHLASMLWPAQDPIGRQINTDDPAKPVWRQVVGIVAPTRNQSLDLVARPGVYVPLSQTDAYVSFVVLKTSAGPRDAERLLKSAVAGVDPNQSVFFIQSLPDLINDTIATRRFLFVVLVFFAAAALLLSTLGVYGLITFIAASRTREVGIRVALGASRANIGRLILTQGIWLTLFGEAAGVLASTAIARLLSSQLYGVRTFDAATTLLTVAILAIATTAAALIPAYRSTLIQPTLALRAE
jgi:putative ABC transport system permease protein